jgi:histidinol-phosphate aminotransferase
VELSRPLVVGVGARRGTPAEEILRLTGEALASAGLSQDAIALLATVDTKTGEPGLRAAAHRLGVPLVGHPAAVLAAVTVPHPSALVRSAVGTPSVAEAAALVEAPGGELVVPKRTSAGAAVAIARRWPANTPASMEL